MLKRTKWILHWQKWLFSDEIVVLSLLMFYLWHFWVVFFFHFKINIPSFRSDSLISWTWNSVVNFSAEQYKCGVGSFGPLYIDILISWFNLESKKKLQFCGKSWKHWRITKITVANVKKLKSLKNDAYICITYSEYF